MKKDLYLIVLLFVISQSIKVTAQLDCSNAILMAINKTTHGNTSNSKNNNSIYNNDNFWQNTGPEDVYKLVWPGGDASIRLSNKTAALDLIILSDCDPVKYLAGGANTGTNESVIITNLPAGTYYIVIDGWELAKGSYDLTVSKLRQAVTVSSRNFYLLPNDSTLNELKGSTSKVLLSGVESIGNYFGYVTNPVTGEGKQESVLAIKRYGHALPKVFLNENFNTDYLKQKLSCPQKNLTLYGEQVFDGNKEILTGCDILRCENGYTLSHQQDGKIKLLNADGNTWLDIKQIITISNRSYYIKQSDNSVWFLNGNRVVMIGSNAKLLQENDNDLIKIDIQGNYQRWNGSIWNNLTPKYIGVSPDITNEAFWSFIQAKYLLERSDIQTSHKMGLTFDNNDQLIMELIPAIGNCDRFLWRTVDAGAGKRILINKAKGDSKPLLMSESGALTFESGQGVKEWEIKQSDINKYGTNAFQLIGANASQALTFNFIFKSVQTSNNPINGNRDQTWIFQFNQMVKDYFLPLPTKANLLAHYVDNPNVNVHTAADSIGTSYNKFLKGTHGVTFFATNTSSDWVLVNYYFIIKNMLNAVITPKPSDTWVDPNIIKTLDTLKGQSLVLINKNDLNAVVPNQYFTPWLSKEKTSELRGSAAYLSLQKAILASEELTCKTGIINRPLDNSNRRFDHGVHEFAHALQELCGYISIVDANNMCPSEVGRSSECFCFDIQNWFNSNAPAYHFPGLRAYDARRSNFMSRIFNAENTWMPPADIRQDGYNPSSGLTVSLAAQSFSSSLCDSTVGYKVKNCVSANNAQFQSISVSGLPSNLSNEYGLKSIYIEAVIPGKLASVQPYVDLIDPKGVQHRLFNPQSFPQFDGTKQEFKVTFSACNSGGIPNANVNQPFQVNGLYRPMGDNPLNKVNATNFNLNGEWKLSLCTGAEFTLKCFKLDFGPTCPALKNHKIVTENCKSFVQILFNDIDNPFCDDQDGNFLPDYYIKMVGSQNPITTWDYANHLKLLLPEGKSMIEFGTYYKNSQGVEHYSCPQFFEVNVTFRDTVKPIIQNCPANATLTLDLDGQAFYNLKHPTFSDNCGTPTSLLNISFLDGATDLGGGVLYKNLPTNPEQSVPYMIKGVGRQVFEFVITDATGNSATCTTVITSLPNPNNCTSDTVKPSIQNCPANTTVTLDADGKVFYNLKHPKFTDNCNVLTSTVNISFMDGATDLGGGINYNQIPTYPEQSVPYVIKGVGRQVFEFVTMDAAGNRNTCITTVTALPNPDTCIHDTVAPFFEGEKCNQHRILYLDHADHVINFVHQDPAYVENCDVASATYTLTYKKRATDKDGNILSGPYKIEPGKFQVFYIKGIGILELKYTVIDKKGNIGTCISTVETRFKGACTEDVTPPTLTSCMPDSIFTINSPSDTHTINFTSPKITDNCGIDSTRLVIQYLESAKRLNGETYREYFHLGSLENKNEVALLGAGKVIVTFYAYDFAGNVSTCKTTISTRSNYVEPCDSFNPILTSINNNCIDILQVEDTTGVYRIDWKNGNKVIKTSVIDLKPANEGIRVAGTGIAFDPDIEIQDTDFDYSASDIAVDKAGNVYVADKNKQRILKFAPGDSTGVVVAGGNGFGSELNQFATISGICLDKEDNLYVSELINDRVTKWPPGATSGTIVAGGNGVGDAANQLNYPRGISVDANGNIYIADTRNGRVQKWAPGATNGITVGGGGEQGSDVFRFIYIADVAVNANFEIFVLDERGTVKKLPPNSTKGTDGVIVVEPWSEEVLFMCVDAAGYIYVSDPIFHNVKRFPSTGTATTEGIIVAGGNEAGNAANQLNYPLGVAVDANHMVYVLDQLNHRVQKWSQTPGSLNNLYTPSIVGSFTAEITRADGCKKTTNTIVLSEPNTLALTVITTPNTGTNNGTATATVSGGTSPYTYKWSTGDNTDVIKNLPAGVYEVTVSDANGCNQSDSATVMHLPEEIGCWESVAAGGAFTIGKKNDGSIWSWGYNGDGQLGDGTTFHKNKPTQIGTATNWKSISTGTNHSHAIKDDGSLWSWGANEYGQLGDGTYENRTIPIQIGKDTNWMSILTNTTHSIAIKKDGTLWAWGSNEYGQLGDGTYDGRNIPMQIGTANDWQSIFAGYSHSLAIKKDGTLWAWGDDNNGKLGQGFIESQLAPVQIGTATDWQSVSGGSHHSFAIKKDSTLWAWGWNIDGELGDGTTDDKHSPVQIGIGTHWQSVLGGLYYSMAIKTDGTLWTWGYEFGNLDSYITYRNRPTQIGIATDWQNMGAGHEFGIAKKSDGSLWSWGRNSLGQLGDGTTINKSTPTQITPCPESTIPIAGKTYNFSRSYSIHAYPNPFTEVLYIEVNLNEPNPLEVEVIDALGRILRVDKSSPFSKKHYIQIQNLDYRGLLFLKIKSIGRYDVVKLLKN